MSLPPVALAAQSVGEGWAPSSVIGKAGLSARRQRDPDTKCARQLVGLLGVLRDPEAGEDRSGAATSRAPAAAANRVTSQPIGCHASSGP